MSPDLGSTTSGEFLSVTVRGYHFKKSINRISNVTVATYDLVKYWYDDEVINRLVYNTKLLLSMVQLDTVH